MKSIKRTIRYETVTRQECSASLAACGILSCGPVLALPRLSSHIDFRPQGLASRLLHDAKFPSQHAASRLASSCPYVSNKRFFMNLENQTMSDSLKIEFHAHQTMSDSLKIELHVLQAMSDSLKIELLENQTMSCGLKIEFHAVQTMSDGLKIELSLLGGMFAYFASCVCSQAVVCYSFIIIK